MTEKILPYNPGVLPTKPAPSKGEVLHFVVDGLPPIKQQRISLRDPNNPKYQRFVDLRLAASKAMNARAWSFGAIRLDVEIYYRTKVELEVPLVDYVGGIMDTLDGSSGAYFTYLPIVYEDDCQVYSGISKFEKADKTYYVITIKFA